MLLTRKLLPLGFHKIKENHFECYVKMADCVNLISVAFHQMHANIHRDDSYNVIGNMCGDLKALRIKLYITKIDLDQI